MRPILPTTYTVEHAGISFRFRQLSTAQGLLLQELLFEPFAVAVKAGEAPRLMDMARMYAVLVGLSWDPSGPHGALDLATPPISEWSRERFAEYGREALDELSAGGLTLEDLQVLGLAIRPRLLGRPPLSEASDTADFSAARRGEAPSSPPISG